MVRCGLETLKEQMALSLRAFDRKLSTSRHIGLIQRTRAQSFMVPNLNKCAGLIGGEVQEVLQDSLLIHIVSISAGGHGEQLLGYGGGVVFSNSFPISIALLIIAPPSIFAIEYTLAILFLFYSIGVLVLTYQAIRDTEYPTRIDELRPERFERFEKCAICQEDSPYEKLIEIHCRASDERTPPVRHAFHEDCIIKSWEARMVFANAGQEYQCPICRQEPNGYNRRFGPPRPNIFDNSRLMWYINSLFTRRLVLVMRNFTRRPRYVFQGHPYSANTIYYIQLLPKVLLVHLFLVLTLLFYIRFATLTFFLPFSWSVWIVVLGISIAFLNKFSEITHDRLYEVAYNGIFRIGLVVFDFIDFFAYLLPTRAPPAPNPPNDGRPVRDGLNNGGANNGGANNDAPNNNVPDNGAPNENVDILIDIDDNEANDGERDGADESDDGDDDDGLPYRLTPLQFAQVYVRVVWFYTNRLIWFVGCHVIFDLTKYVALNISRFVMLVALYNVVVFLFFALESPLVTPSTASN
ncbi:hypothetical protein RRF57_003542 [Xylaria bambusicola]|uniref:RING-type domain-containing protein n=1 Tax=Xylaria bambusicola TaxID=326684 RepID=A0AAN7Z2X0_9PEZI